MKDPQTTYFLLDIQADPVSADEHVSVSPYWR
jgi:hypothetical protein